MKLSQIGITILTVGTIIISGCAADGSYTSETGNNNTVDSPLVEFGPSATGLVRHSNLNIASAIRGLYKKPTKTTTHDRWTFSCANRCRSEAAEARRRCYKDKAPSCEREAQDVFDTCFQYECQDGGHDTNNAFGQQPMPSNPIALAEVALDPAISCRETCAKYGTKVYLQCLEETNAQDPVRCRNNSEYAAAMCVREQCPGE